MRGTIDHVWENETKGIGRCQVHFPHDPAALPDRNQLSS
jgi:hypothetical protein